MNEGRRVFETKTEQSKPPAVVPVLRVSDAKKAFENSVAAATASSSSKSERLAGAQSHHSLPRRTLIQTPASTVEVKPSGTQQPRNQTSQDINSVVRRKRSETGFRYGIPLALDNNFVKYHQGLQPGEKVVVGGLGVKIGAIGKVTEIGMKVKTEDSNPVPTPQTNTSPKKPSTARPISPSKTRSNKNEKNQQQDQQSQPQSKEALTSGRSKKQSQQPGTREIQVVLDTGEAEPKIASMLVADEKTPSRPSSPPLLVRPNPPTVPASSKAKIISPTTQPPKTAPKPVERVISPPPLGRVTSPPPTGRVTSPPPIGRITSPLPLGRVTSPVPFGRVTSPPPLGRIRSPSPFGRVTSPPPPGRVTSPPMGRVASPPPQVLQSLVRALSPSRPAQSSASSSRPMSPSPPSRPMSPVRLVKDEEGSEDVIAGSENAFIRSIRSPTKEAGLTSSTPLAKTTVTTSTTAIKDSVAVQPEPIKMMQKTEISIPVSATSLAAAPRERIIPIRVEGRDHQEQEQQSATALPRVAVSVQMRGTPPRIVSPPPTINKPIRTKYSVLPGTVVSAFFHFCYYIFFCLVCLSINVFAFS